MLGQSLRTQGRWNETSWIFGLLVVDDLHSLGPSSQTLPLASTHQRARMQCVGRVAEILRVHGTKCFFVLQTKNQDALNSVRQQGGVSEMGTMPETQRLTGNTSRECPPSHGPSSYTADAFFQPGSLLPLYPWPPGGARHRLGCNANTYRRKPNSSPVTLLLSDSCPPLQPAVLFKKIQSCYKK